MPCLPKDNDLVTVFMVLLQFVNHLVVVRVPVISVLWSVKHTRTHTHTHIHIHIHIQGSPLGVKSSFLTQVCPIPYTYIQNYVRGTGRTCVCV